MNLQTPDKRLGGQVPLTSRDQERISKDLRARLDDGRALLRRHVPQARKILRKLLVDLPQGMASPRGIALMWTPKLQGQAQVAVWLRCKQHSKTMPFEPGQSGNQLGRPKGSCNKTRRAVREWATGIVEDPRVQARLLAMHGRGNSIRRC